MSNSRRQPWLFLYLSYETPLIPLVTLSLTNATTIQHTEESMHLFSRTHKRLNPFEIFVAANVADQARLFAVACIRLVRLFPSGCSGCSKRSELSPYAELHSPRSAFVSTKVRMVPVDRFAEIWDDYRSIDPLAPRR